MKHNNQIKIKAMKFIEYSTQWAKGEIFEGLCVTLFGVLIIVCTAMLHKFGTTINAKALIIPTLIIGLLFGMLGSYMLYSNNQRINQFESEYQANPTTFIENEKKRVEEFQILYPISLAISAVCFFVTILVFTFSKSPNFHAIGVALSILGLTLIIIDYFSKERAQIYYEHILNQIQ